MNINIEKEGLKIVISWLECVEKNFQWQRTNCESHLKKEAIKSAEETIRAILAELNEELEEE